MLPSNPAARIIDHLRASMFKKLCFKEPPRSVIALTQIISPSGGGPFNESNPAAELSSEALCKDNEALVSLIFIKVFCNATNLTFRTSLL